MPCDFPLRASLAGLQEKMLIDFSAITAQIEHRGAKGREREALIAQEYLQQPYARVLVPGDGGKFSGRILEFPGCVAEGATRNEALEAAGLSE